MATATKSKSKSKSLPPKAKATREQWLLDAAQWVMPVFTAAGLKMPDHRVTCGWPASGGKAGKARQRIGECWSPKASDDGTTEMFISPVLADRTTVLATLVHEMLHACLGLEAGHKAPFKQAMPKVGLTGKATATGPAPEFATLYAEAFKRLPEYPHAKLNPAESGVKKQTTRMVKLVCEGCGWTCRAAQKWIDAGLPTCACGSEIHPEEAD